MEDRSTVKRKWKSGRQWGNGEIRKGREQDGSRQALWYEKWGKGAVDG